MAPPPHSLQQHREGRGLPTHRHIPSRSGRRQGRIHLSARVEGRQMELVPACPNQRGHARLQTWCRRGDLRALVPDYKLLLASIRGVYALSTVQRGMDVYFMFRYQSCSMEQDDS